MAKYRKKPVVIEAERFDGTENSIIKIIALSQGSERTKWIRAEAKGLLIPTLEGTMWADIGDFVIRGVQGELYPCKPDIFEATYEPVDGETL
jgi:hypothetical protein